MPAGDPAGYLPNVIRKRIKKAGATPYKVRGKRAKPLRNLRPGVPKRKPSPTGGVEGPPPMRPKAPVTSGNLVPLPRRGGGGGDGPVPRMRRKKKRYLPRRSGF